MHAVTEPHMAVGIAGDVEPVGIGELIGVAIGGADHDVENLAFADLYAADFKILARGTDATLGRRVEAEEFLSRQVDELRAGLVAAPVWCSAPLITSPPVFARPNAMPPRVAIAELFSLAHGQAADVLAIS